MYCQGVVVNFRLDTVEARLLGLECHVAELQENPDARGGVRAYALDGDHAKALWAKSEAMVGETF